MSHNKHLDLYHHPLQLIQFTSYGPDHRPLPLYDLLRLTHFISMREEFIVGFLLSRRFPGPVPQTAFVILVPDKMAP